MRHLIPVMTPNPERDRLFKGWAVAHRGIVARIASSFARESSSRADLEQEILLQLWRSAGSFAGQSKESTWIYRVALNTALMWHRGVDRREQRTSPQSSFDAVAEVAPSPADSAAREDLLEVLYGAIRSLGGTDRALVLLSLDGLAYREITEITGMNENQVGVALTRARAKLAERLKGVRNELE